MVILPDTKRNSMFHSSIVYIVYKGKVIEWRRRRPASIKVRAKVIQGRIYTAVIGMHVARVCRCKRWAALLYIYPKRQMPLLRKCLETCEALFFPWAVVCREMCLHICFIRPTTKPISTAAILPVDYKQMEFDRIRWRLCYIAVDGGCCCLQYVSLFVAVQTNKCCIVVATHRWIPLSGVRTNASPCKIDPGLGSHPNERVNRWDWIDLPMYPSPWQPKQTWYYGRKWSFKLLLPEKECLAMHEAHNQATPLICL